MSLNCYFNLVLLKRVYMTSFSCHKNAKKKFQTLFLGQPFTSPGKMICHFYRGGGQGGYSALRFSPLEKLPVSYTFHWQMVPLSHA